MKVEFRESERFNVELSQEEFNVDFSDMQTVTSYDGEYEITPRLYPQELETKSKLMQDDVTIYEIPVTTTTNPHGGQTILIG